MARADGAERPVTLGVEERSPIAARTKSKVTPKYKTKYRVENWPAYEASLRQRGDVTVWFDEGAYDTRAVYEALAAAGGERITVVIPPRKDATLSTSGDDVLRQRDAAIIRIEEVGRRRWRKESGAHQQARTENAMLRYKRIIG